MVESHQGDLDKIKNISGWTSKAYGLYSEFIVFRWLEHQFRPEICCLINSFQCGKLLKILAEPGGKREFDHLLLHEVRAKNCKKQK